VAGGGDIIVILSSRVLGVWGTVGFGDEMRGIRIIFGCGGFRKWIERIIGIYIVKNTRNDYKYELYTRLIKENIANMESPIDIWNKNKENI